MSGRVNSSSITASAAGPSTIRLSTCHPWGVVGPEELLPVPKAGRVCLDLRIAVARLGVDEDGPDLGIGTPTAAGCHAISA